MKRPSGRAASLERLGLTSDRRRIVYAYLAAILLFVIGEIVHPGFASPGSITATVPAGSGIVVVTVTTPGGTSNNFNLVIYDAAPAIFRSGTAGPLTGLATVVRVDDNQLVTPTNPIHPGDTIVIYATGLGRTQPSVDAGMPAPSEQISVSTMPNFRLGSSSTAPAPSPNRTQVARLV